MLWPATRHPHFSRGSCPHCPDYPRATIVLTLTILDCPRLAASELVLKIAVTSSSGLKDHSTVPELSRLAEDAGEVSGTALHPSGERSTWYGTQPIMELLFLARMPNIHQSSMSPTPFNPESSAPVEKEQALEPHMNLSPF